MSNERASNPILDETVNRALASYKDVLPPDVLEEFRDALAEALAEHPVSKTLLNRLRDRRVPDQSGDQVRPGVEVADDDAVKRGAKGG